MAQLMRIHVVTPKAPVHVTLNPMVQLDENGGPIFVTGFDIPIELTQSTYWVLRLPYPLDFSLLYLNYNSNIVKKVTII